MTTRHQLIGSSVFVTELREEIAWAAPSDASVLVTGESGVGKEAVARFIHQESPRRVAPLVAVNCARIPDSLLESELFERGLLDQAQGGTIFLDEIGEVSLRMQAALLRFLENSAGLRVVAATKRNLLERIAAKGFREDLYYRLNVIHLAIPPLRARKEDIQPLLTHFIGTFAKAQLLPQPVLPAETLDRLCDYSWPGNVRELKNVAERLVVRAQFGVIPPADLPTEILGRWSRHGAVKVQQATPGG